MQISLLSIFHYFFPSYSCLLLYILRALLSLFRDWLLVFLWSRTFLIYFRKLACFRCGCDRDDRWLAHPWYHISFFFSISMFVIFNLRFFFLYCPSISLKLFSFLLFFQVWVIWGSMECLFQWYGEQWSICFLLFWVQGKLALYVAAGGIDPTKVSRFVSVKLYWSFRCY